MKKEYDFSKGERGKFYYPDADVEYMIETKPITIRLDISDLDLLKEKAKKEGLKYQTYIKSQLHKIAIQ